MRYFLAIACLVGSGFAEDAKMDSAAVSLLFGAAAFAYWKYCDDEKAEKQDKDDLL